MKEKYLFALIIVLFSLLSVHISNAQNISGIVNTYAKVTTISGNRFTIGTPAGRTGARIQDFNDGQKVLIYQAKGASINKKNNSQFGKITDLANAGKYEIATVVSRSGRVVTFSNLINTYDIKGLVQLINIPVYTKDNTSVTAKLTALAWDKSLGYGGVLILEAKRLTLNANIDVDGKGFVGGARSANNGSGCVTVYRETNTIYGEKGEGITTYSTHTRGQGPLANGGGGASTHNGGGGGGSNHGKGSQGGIGWSCSASTNAGGFGGSSLSYTASSQRLFLGGGGGGGQQNNGIGSNGGNGGGIVFLLLNELTTNCSATHAISARGKNSASTEYDGVGGAGAGGVIYIHTKAYNSNSCKINLNVDGGNGGNINDSGSHGGGGGGGSGVIYTSIPFVSGINVSGSNGSDGNDNSSGGQSGIDGVDELVDIVVKPNIPPGAEPINGPGGHTSGLRMWLKADETKLFSNADLSSPISNGQELKSWENEASSNNYINISGISSNTTFLNSLNDQLNFNSIVRLKNTDRNLRSETSLKAQTLVVVTKSSSSTEFKGLVGLEGNRGIRSSNDANTWGSGSTNDWSNGGAAFVNGVLGNTHSQAWHIVYQEKGTSVTNNLFVGGYYASRSFSGDIAEVIAYEDRLDNGEQGRIESYLAMKYGLTLDQSSAQNYVSSNGTIVWSGSVNSSYNTDIAGIARDDNTVLNQLKSRSVNNSSVVTISNGTDINAPANFSLDNAYLIWGHNGGSNTALTGDFLGKTDLGIARVWKISEKGSVGNVRLAIANADIPSTMTNLLISSDPTFPNTAATRKIVLSTGAIREASANFTDGDYFTFSKTNSAPVLANMDVSIINYCKNDVVISDAITVTDDDGDDVTAIITFESGYQAGEDALVYTLGVGVTLVFQTVEQIEIKANVVDMQAALRTITYKNSKTDGSRTTGSRVISIILNDGIEDGLKRSRTINPSVIPRPIGIFY